MKTAQQIITYTNHEEAGQLSYKIQQYQDYLQQISDLKATIEQIQSAADLIHQDLISEFKSQNMTEINFTDWGLSFKYHPATTKVSRYDWNEFAHNFNQIYPQLDQTLQNQLSADGLNDSKNWMIETVDPTITNKLLKLKNIKTHLEPFAKTTITSAEKITISEIKTPSKSKTKTASL